MNEQQLLQDTLSVWCPNYPRQVSALRNTPRGWGQVEAHSEQAVIENIKSVKYHHPGFVSVYSFPNGHTSEEGENIPCIDTLMFDLDFEGEKEASKETWARDMSALLTRTRMIAKALLDMGKAKYWRASLSGHKGIHLYLDFPALENSIGSEAQFRQGMADYTADIKQALTEETGLSNLDDYIDVSSGRDLARLTRLPNTVHDGATSRFGELRYCVPVTIEELAHIGPQDYIRLTKSQRAITESMRRTENEKAGQILTESIRLASSSSTNLSTGDWDSQRIRDYKRESNDAITLEKVKLYSKRKPCIWAFRESGAMFKKGNQSHTMEINCIAFMVNLNVPIDVMVEFFDTAENFDPEYTEDKICEVIAYGYDEFNCSTILRDAESFCLKEQCNIYNESSDLKELSSD